MGEEVVTIAYVENKNKMQSTKQSAKNIKANINKKQKFNNDNLFGANREEVQESSPRERSEKEGGIAKKRFKKEWAE